MNNSDDIFEFVRKTVSIHNYERLCDLNNEFNSQNYYDAWLVHQQQLIDTLSQKDQSHVRWLISMINQKYISNMDLERCTIFKTYGFYFDDVKGLVIFNDR